MIHTPLCDILGIDHPILNAPMSGTATATLAAAVSHAGGFGMIGGTSRGGADWLRAQIRATRAKTGRPFGVGFISSFPTVDDLVQVALDEQVAVINHSFADPTPYVAAAKARGVRVFAQVQSLAQAQRAATAGVDAIIAQGTEAGGHTGMAGTLALAQRWVGKRHELKRLLREPHARIRVHLAPNRVDHVVARTEATAALPIRLTRHLDPQVRVHEGMPGVCGGADTEPTLGRVAPRLRIGEGLRRRPRALTVAARVDNKMRGRRDIAQD